MRTNNNSKNRITIVITLTMSLIVLLSIVQFVYAADVGAEGTEDRALDKYSALWYAHKGDTTLAPENTAEDCVAAVLRGYYCVEIDVVESATEKKYAPYIVACHSDNLASIGGPDMDIAQVNSKNRGDITIFEKYKIPTVEEIMWQVWRVNPHCVIEIDIKRSSMSDDAIMKMIHLAGPFHRINICGSNPDTVERLAGLIKSDNVHLWGCVSAKREATKTEFIDACAKLGAKGISITNKSITDEDIAQIKSLGMIPRVRGMESKVEVISLMDRGVGAFMCDNPWWIDSVQPGASEEE